MKRNRVIIFLITGAVLLASWSFGLLEFKAQPRKINGLRDNIKVPAFALFNLNGEKVSTERFQGRVILINFWATWCAPCREEIPYLNELHQKYKEDGLVVIGISLDYGGPEQVAKFLEKYKVEYINLMGDDAVVKAFSSIPGMSPNQAIPTTFLIDREGQVSRKFVGLTKKQVFEEAIKPLL